MVDYRVHRLWIQQLNSRVPSGNAGLFEQEYGKSLTVNDVYNDSVLDYYSLWCFNRGLAEHGLQTYGSISEIPTVALNNINSTFLSEIYRNAGDPRATMDRNTLTEQTSEICLALGDKVQNIWQVYALENATYREGGAANLKSILKLMSSISSSSIFVSFSLI